MQPAVAVIQPAIVVKIQPEDTETGHLVRVRELLNSEPSRNLLTGALGCNRNPECCEACSRPPSDDEVAYFQKLQTPLEALPVAVSTQHSAWLVVVQYAEGRAACGVQAYAALSGSNVCGSTSM